MAFHSDRMSHAPETDIQDDVPVRLLVTGSVHNQHNLPFFAQAKLMPSIRTTGGSDIKAGRHANFDDQCQGALTMQNRHAGAARAMVDCPPRRHAGQWLQTCGDQMALACRAAAALGAR